MRHSVKTGLSFGMTSAIITTMGLMVGLHSSTYSRLAVIGGILIIAIADAFSDALGIHVSEESENRHSGIEIWEATITTFFSKFIFALTFIVPILSFSILKFAIAVNIIWGLCLLSVFSYYMAKTQRTDPWKIVGEHLVLAIIVIIIAHLAGDGIKLIFS